jgi:hypothetical protein
MPAIAEKTIAGIPPGKTTGIENGNSPSFSARLPPMPQIRMVAPTARWRGSNWMREGTGPARALARARPARPGCR